MNLLGFLAILAMFVIGASIIVGSVKNEHGGVESALVGLAFIAGGVIGLLVGLNL